MNARDDYPKLANKAANPAIWFSGGECRKALDEIDRLRKALRAADGYWEWLFDDGPYPEAGGER